MSSAARPAHVSVIIPTYNRAAFLGAAIASVRAQTFTDWELLVVDDGSTDGTRALLEALSDPRIRILTRPHSGSESIARNAGLRAARGEWVAFLDSDDLWLPEKLERQLRLVSRQPGCRWSYTGVSYIGVDGAPTSRPTSPGRAAAPGRTLEALLRFEVAASIPTLLVRLCELEAVGWMDESLPLRADYDLMLRLAIRGDALVLPDALTLVREHRERTTSQRRPAELFALNERVLRKMANGAPDAAIRALCRRQCATQRAGAARALSREGAHGQAFNALARALRDTPFEATVWRAAARCVFGILPMGARAAESRNETVG